MVTGVLAVRNGQTDLAMGNALGSCIFTPARSSGIAGLIAPPAADTSLTLPLAFMGLLAIALIPISRTFGRTVSRLEGALLLASYVAFLALSVTVLPRG